MSIEKIEKKEKKYNETIESLTSELLISEENKQLDEVESIKLKKSNHEDEKYEKDENLVTQEDSERLLKKLQFRIPLNLKKTCWLTSILLLIGIGLLVAGIVVSIVKNSFNEGVTYFIIAFIVIIPGGFYTFQFLKARFTKDIDKRDAILAEIPSI